MSSLIKVLNNASLAKLEEGVHPHLCKVVELAFELSPNAFIITEGLRTKKRQAQLLASGASTTMNSRHLTGHAVDVAVLVGGKIRWDWPLYDQLSEHFKEAARRLSIPIEWGGDWPRLRDGPHYQLPWKQYPLNDQRPIPQG